MATPIPIDELPILDAHQLQQALLERDESAERLVRINELEAEIAAINKDASGAALAVQDQIAALEDEKTKMTNTLQNIGTKAAAIQQLIGDSPEVTAAKIAQAVAEKEKAEAIIAALSK